MSREPMMNELHPEELLAKASRVALDAGEAADLRAHLGRCPACALQVGLRGEIDGALAPTALDYEIGARAVERLFASRELGPARSPIKERAARRAPPLVTRVALGLALVLGTSVVASAFVLGTRGRLWDVAAPDRETAPVLRGHARRAAGAHALVDVDAVEPETLQNAPAPAAPLPMAPPPVVSAPPPVVSAPASLAGVAAPASPVAAPRPAVVPLRAASRRATLAAREEGGTDDGASGVFGAAESARGRGDLAEARRLYAELASRFRGTREELSARVLGGQMLLDDLDEPAAALGAFDRYLRDEPAGTLAEEAVVGRAQALRRLGRADAEAAAWNDLLVRYPRSVHAELARERLAALVPAP